MNTVVFFIWKSSVLLRHKDGQSYWYNFIFNILNHCKPSELFNMLHSARMAYTLPRLWNCHTSKWIQVVDKNLLLQIFTDAEQLPFGLENEAGVWGFILYIYCSIFCLVMDMEYPILPLVEFTAIVFLQVLVTMSLFFVLSWNVICKLKELVEG